MAMAISSAMIAAAGWRVGWHGALSGSSRMPLRTPLPRRRQDRRTELQMRPNQPSSCRPHLKSFVNKGTGVISHHGDDMAICVQTASPVDEESATFKEQISEGRRRRQLFLCAFLLWVPIFALFWTLSLFCTERVANVITVMIALAWLFVVRERYMRWRCPRCSKRFFVAPAIEFGPRLSWPFGRRCRHCGLEI